MAVQIKRGNAAAALSITPLIDVVFLLLIFFLVSTRFADEDRELDVNLPTASEAVPLTWQPNQIFVNIDHEGQFYLGRRAVTPDELERRLQQAALDNPTTQSVIIRADEETPLRYAVFAVNACRKANITDYKLNTEGNLP